MALTKVFPNDVLVASGLGNVEFHNLANDARKIKPHNIVTFLCGSDDEVITAYTNCSVSVDTTDFVVGDRAIKITLAGAATATVVYDPVSVIEDPLLFGPASWIGMKIFVPDITKVSQVNFEIYTDSGLTTAKRFQRAFYPTVNGLNSALWPSNNGLTDLTNWGQAYRVRIVVVASAATTVTVGHVYAGVPEKAQLLFVADRGYKTLFDYAYPDLKARNIPVTIAISPALMGTSSGKTEVISEASLAIYAAENRNQVSFHSFDGSVTSAMTAAQIRADTVKCLKWLASRGYRTPWRAAWVQNAATNAAAAKPYLYAYATPSSSAGVLCWPFSDRWNIGRSAIHGNATFPAKLAVMEKTRGLLVVYEHGYHVDGGNDVTPTEWAAFMANIDAAIAAGWLEGTTFEMLCSESGWNWQQDWDGASALVVPEIY